MICAASARAISRSSERIYLPFLNHRTLNSMASYARLNSTQADRLCSLMSEGERGPASRAIQFLHERYSMATRWDELIAEYDKISTQAGQAQFITDWTGFSEECTRRVLGHLLTQPVFSSDEWDLKAQARNAGVSFDEYAVAMIPYMRMSVERSEARLREIKARIDSGDDPRFSDEELEQSKKWKAFVETVASLSGEETEVVYQIWDAVAAFKTRQQEILHELIRLTPRGVKDAVIAFFLNKAGTAQIGEHLLRCDTDFIPPLSGRVEINDYAQK